MKQARVVLIFLILFKFSVCQNVQSLKDYKDFQSIGETWNANKIGKWIDFSVDSVIYRSGTYDSTGTPIGTWSVYFPNGELRKTTEYEDGSVIQWSCYLDNKKIIEVSGNKTIDPNVFREILYRETDAMQHNDNPYHFTLDKADDFGSYQAHYTYYINHIRILYYELLKLLRNIEFNGSLKKWGIEGKLRNDHHFKNGNDFETEYIYKKDRLKFSKDIINDTVKTIISYRKDGSIKLVKDK